MIQHDSTILWEPNEQWISQSNLKKFSEQIRFPLFPYDRLHRWSIANPEAFWSAVWDFADVIGDKGENFLSLLMMVPWLGQSGFLKHD
ncbi:hypothetical protein ACI2OX_16915 [Bacillus sp. N9]